MPRRHVETEIRYLTKQGCLRFPAASCCGHSRSATHAAAPWNKVPVATGGSQDQPCEMQSWSNGAS